MDNVSGNPIEAKYTKAICHLNQARSMNRLGLILGAGVSRDLKIPDWPELIKRIEKKLNYPSGLAPETYRAEQLYQHYRKKKIHELNWETDEKIDAAIVSGWRDVVSKSLYKNFVGKDNKIKQSAYENRIRRHRYLVDLGQLARKAVLVVTHNFDDALECAIDLDASTSERAGRRYHSFWKPEPFLRSNMVNIYHPNGYTPLRVDAKGSENLLLTEGGFADHLANTNTEESHFLVRHLADKTCLIIGHSLADGTLKNALRQHANQRPGHVNYYIHWNSKGAAGLNDAQRHAIREANFETYNLVTIFANSSEISKLVKLISMEVSDLEGLLAKQSLPSRFVYYIAGAVSSGKSTVLRHFRNLATIEEWPNRMPVEMNRQSIGLSKNAQKKIDSRLEDAIWHKNSEIRDIKVGLVAVDRGPLDFIAFPAKASETIGTTARDRTQAVLGKLAENNLQGLCHGQVILLSCDPKSLCCRQLKRGRITTKEAADGSSEYYLKKQQKLLSSIYGTGSLVRTDGHTVNGSLKAIARMIHLNSYSPCNFGKSLQSIKKKR